MQDADLMVLNSAEIPFKLCKPSKRGEGETSSSCQMVCRKERVRERSSMVREGKGLEISVGSCLKCRSKKCLIPEKWDCIKIISLKYRVTMVV